MFVFILTGFLQMISAQITTLDTADLRTPDQVEDAPNEPPFNNALEAEATLDDERPLEEEESNVKRIPRWKRQKRAVPEEDRVKQLGKEKGLFKITKKNEYLYQVKKTPQKNGFSFRFGSLNLSNLENSAVGYTYDDIYGGGTSVLILADWEWQFFKKLGKLGLKIGSGISFSQGSGKWAPTSPNFGTGREPREKYSFYLFPNNVALSYRADYFNKQIIVPYGEAGFDYFTFAEVRDDNKFSYGGAMAWHVAGGLAFSLNWLNPSAMIELDKEQGINNIYLVAEYRIITGLDSEFDFSDNVINGGFFIEY